MNCTEGCVLWSQHLRRWEGWWAEGRVSGPDGPEEEKMGRGGQDSGGEKTMDDQKRGKKQKTQKR